MIVCNLPCKWTVHSLLLVLHVYVLTFLEGVCIIMYKIDYLSLPHLSEEAKILEPNYL